ncbi:hypothetical protein HYFRA_00007451 [Hymenoscyphus fraxineus]|uniref:ZZ-type domain-containing protein n=1 Tax=Hymenoscyphus fraxineus TaxID=746836 RepID=A0A9N9KPA8_9HELO|nr:hypothetical protein HYFRA_00007451 [Hymenoscyphus fraxineus]
MASNSQTNPDTLVTLKINVEGTNRRFKLPLRDLGASTLPDKLRFLLSIPPTSEAIFERYSDSAASFVVLDSENASVYKQLYRAAKAKLKLRLKVTVKDKEPVTPKPATVEDEESIPVSPVEATSTEPQQQIQTEVVPEPTSDMSSVEQHIAPGSVAEIQRGLEELIINQPRYYASKEPEARHASINASGAPTASGCTRFMNNPMNIAATNICGGVPIPRATREHWSQAFHDRQHAALNQAGPQITCNIFSVYCNHCQDSIPDEHFHCSTCDDGDFDLCQKCVTDGVRCGGDEHWMIKRFFNHGKVINSTTETIKPKPKVPAPAPSPLLESEDTLLLAESKMPIATRTCNCCIQELTEENFVTCTSCDDFDLCINCHVDVQHGHHPKHGFVPAVEDANLSVVAQALLGPGRNIGHNAVCDGCDKYIYGVRHKCLDCPDWDFCSTCVPNANFIHPNHRFVPIYEPLNDLAALHRSYSSKARHHGIYCDGPLCKAGNQTYIKGDRYKCAVCHDTDFCASCEASPSNPHNQTHPLIKFKTPVRNVSVTTLGDHEDGKQMAVMGDRLRRTTHKATETIQTQSANAATQVQTVADLQPTEPVKYEETHEIEALKTPEPEPKVEEVKELPAERSEDLVAHFVRDVIADGTILPPNCVFEQTWYLRNSGNTSWPAGCRVKFVSGNNMCAIDPAHPASVHELISAGESTTCYTEVAPGQEMGFTVLLRTPSRPGNVVSYWRLTGPDGDKFGHRLWCDVTVAPQEEPIVKEEPKEESVEIKAEPERSQMIFPTLDKESPSNSIHEQAPVAAPIASPVASIQDDDFEDFVDELDDETDDGFMTDEEYDILDASDEEYLAEQEKSRK